MRSISTHRVDAAQDRTNLMDVLRERRDTLPPSEARVADAILAEPTKAVKRTLAQLATASGVSQPTVLRLGRRLGMDGYQAFKVRLAQSLVTHSAYADLEVQPGDPAATYPRKVIDGTIDALVRLRAQLDTDAIEAAVDALHRARKIEFYGLGASGAVAIDAQHKFFRLRAPCIAYTDPHMQSMSAATLTAEDVVVAISHTGRTRELIESVDLAREAGAAVVAITASGTPLATRASHPIAVDVPEDTDEYTPMFSRLLHLVTLDALAVGVALRGGEPIRERLTRMKSMLRTKRLPRDA